MQKVYTCNICGVDHKDANHWFVASTSLEGIELHTWAWAIHEELLDDGQTKHLCGQVCAHKFVDRFMAQETEQST